MEENKRATEIIFYSTPEGDKTLEHQYQAYDFNYGEFAIIILCFTEFMRYTAPGGN